MLFSVVKTMQKAIIKTLRVCCCYCPSTHVFGWQHFEIILHFSNLANINVWTNVLIVTCKIEKWFVSCVLERRPQCKNIPQIDFSFQTEWNWLLFFSPLRWSCLYFFYGFHTRKFLRTDTEAFKCEILCIFSALWKNTTCIKDFTETADGAFGLIP